MITSNPYIRPVSSLHRVCILYLKQVCLKHIDCKWIMMEDFNVLKKELKKWEAAFYVVHGSKPSKVFHFCI